MQYFLFKFCLHSPLRESYVLAVDVQFIFFALDSNGTAADDDDESEWVVILVAHICTRQERNKSNTMEVSSDYKLVTSSSLLLLRLLQDWSFGGHALHCTALP